jgi:hypothetical protein
MKLELKKFNPASIPSDSIIVIIGKRGVGKSVLLKDILYHHRDIPVGVVVSPTETANAYFESFVPKMLLYEEASDEILEKFLKRQIDISTEKKRELKKFGSSQIDARAFLILDDCLYDKKWISSTNIRSIFMNGRHYHIFYIVTLQHALGLSPILRNNIDYVFIFRNNIRKEREKIYNHYAGMFPTFEAFEQVMLQTTENYECMVIDNKTQSNKLEDQVYWYKAEKKDFRMCSPDLWELQNLEEQRQEMGYRKDEDGDDEPFDSGVFTKKKNTNVIKVKKTSNGARYG